MTVARRTGVSPENPGFGSCRFGGWTFGRRGKNRKQSNDRKMRCGLDFCDGIRGCARHACFAAAGHAADGTSRMRSLGLHFGRLAGAAGRNSACRAPGRFAHGHNAMCAARHPAFGHRNGRVLRSYDANDFRCFHGHSREKHAENRQQPYELGEQFESGSLWEPTSVWLIFLSVSTAKAHPVSGRGPVMIGEIGQGKPEG
jgi:hypothetical protein